jgi:hypothetical protein
VNSAVYYIEKRPEEDGRNVIVSLADGVDVFGRDWNARTAVQEYGGSPAGMLGIFSLISFSFILVVHDNIVLFSNFSDGQVYKVDLLHLVSPMPVTGKENYRFADFACHPHSPSLVVCILEDHTKPAPDQVMNSLVCLNTLLSEDPISLVSGSDFYSSPRFNVDGTLLAWTEWAHPDMPWDGFVFLSGPLHDGGIDFHINQRTNFRCCSRRKQRPSSVGSTSIAKAPRRGTSISR